MRTVHYRASTDQIDAALDRHPTAIGNLRDVTSPRVFLTRLAGLPVFDPNGDPVGKVRDLVVTLRTDATPPRVLGMVVEITNRRRIFVPIGRMTSVDPQSLVLSSGTLSVKRFERRPREVLVLAELLDRGVTIVETGTKATLVDVAMEQTRARDWLIVRAAVREIHGSRLTRRKGHVMQLEWSQISGASTQQEPQEAHTLLEEFEDLKAADVAARLKDLPPRRRQEVAEALDDERLADVLEELSEEDQYVIINALDDDRASDVLGAMDPDDAADLLGELSDKERERLLGLMVPADAAPVRRLLIYSEDTAGGIMTSEPIILTPDTTIAEALAHVRSEDLTPALASLVFICRPPSAAPTGRFLGVVHFQRLLREPPAGLVGGIIDDDMQPLRVEATLPELTRYFATYNLVSAPVVDESNRLIGAVTVDDLLDHLLPDDWRDSDE